MRSMNNLLGEVTFRNKLAPGALRRPSSQLPFPLSHLAQIANVLERDKRAPMNGNSYRADLAFSAGFAILTIKEYETRARGKRSRRVYVSTVM